MPTQKLPQDRRRKPEGTHLEKEIKLRVCPADHEELIEASRLAHAENLTGYVRDCMWIGHRLQQGGQKEQVLAVMLLQQRAHALVALFRGETPSPEQLAGLLRDLVQLPPASVGKTKSA